MAYKNKEDKRRYDHVWYLRAKGRYTKKCLQCKKLFKTRHKQPRFCSRSCLGLYRKNKIICPTCGKQFSAPPSKKRKYCSVKCARNSPEIKKMMKTRMELRWKNGEFRDYLWPGPSEETKEKIRERLYNLTGSKNYMWKGGISKVKIQIRKMPEYEVWRKKIFKRDNYTCNYCGKRSGKNHHLTLNADHYPVSFAKIIAQYEINSISEARSCPLFWNIKNGRTLCLDCHKTTYDKRKQELKESGKWPHIENI